MNEHLQIFGAILNDARVKTSLPLGDLARGFEAIMRLDAQLRQMQEELKAHEDNEEK